MSNLKQIQPLVNTAGKLQGLVGLDDEGNVWVAEYTGRQRIKWTRLEEER